MLKGLILWRLTYLTYTIALFLAFMLIAVQLFRLGNVIFGLPPDMSLPFLFVWFSNYSLFFIPDGVFVASVAVVFWLKEKKLLQVIYSFGIPPRRILFYILVPALIFSFLQIAFSTFLHEEKVSFVRKKLILSYKDRLIENLPPRTFLRTGSVVIYAERKDKGGIKNLFFKYKDLTVLAKEAIYEGNEVFVFRDGSLLTRESNKFLLTEFKTYRLNLGESIGSIKYREKKATKAVITNVINSLTTVPLATLGFLITLRYINSVVGSYYLMALGVILHQLFMLFVKLSL